MTGGLPEPRGAYAEREAWETRIRELRGYAAEDGEPFDEESERDLRAFLRSNPSVRKGGLVLVDSGHLRAVWEGDGGALVGVEFLGGGRLRYVIFGSRPGAGGIPRVVGRADFEGFGQQVETFGLSALLYE